MAVLGHKLRRASGNALELSFVDSAESSGSTITIPAGAEIGDLAVLFDHIYDEPWGSPLVVPTDWNSLKQTTYDNGGAYGIADVSSYKILEAGDPGATVTGMNQNTEDKIILVFRPSRPIVSVTPSTWEGASTEGDVSGQSVSASGQDTPVIVLACAGKDAATIGFGTATPAFDDTVSNTADDVIMGYKIYNPGDTPDNHSVDTNTSVGLQGLHSGFLKVS